MGSFHPIFVTGFFKTELSKPVINIARYRWVLYLEYFEIVMTRLLWKTYTIGRSRNFNFQHWVTQAFLSKNPWIIFFDHVIIISYNLCVENIEKLRSDTHILISQVQPQKLDRYGLYHMGQAVLSYWILPEFTDRVNNAKNFNADFFEN